MDIELEPGKYVVAVSGGVDSVVLLDVLTKQPNLELVVAHFDHGIREDSAEDRKIVGTVAKDYGLQYIYEEGKLGSSASEATAREARYQFLHKVRKLHDALAIVTAHHEDDFIETALLNMLRGTNRKGLSSLRATDTIKRPLLTVSKKALIDYANANGLSWREDSTNLDDKYLRNSIRHQLVPKLSADDRAELLTILGQAGTLNDTIDRLLTEQLEQNSQARSLDRRWFIGLPHAVAREILAAWLRQYGVSVDRPMLERVVTAAKTKASGKQIDINATLVLNIQEHKLALATRDR